MLDDLNNFHRHLFILDYFTTGNAESQNENFLLNVFSGLRHNYP